MIKVRLAKPEEAKIIVDFQIKMAMETEELVLSENDLMPGTKAVFQDSSKGVYYVATFEDRVVGCLLITYEWSEWRNGTVLWIQSVYVLKEYRGKRVFRQMYDHVQKKVEEDDALKGIRLYVEKDNHRAQQVYTSLGMNGEHYRMFEWIKE